MSQVFKVIVGKSKQISEQSDIPQDQLTRIEENVPSQHYELYRQAFPTNIKERIDKSCNRSTIKNELRSNQFKNQQLPSGSQKQYQIILNSFSHVCNVLPLCVKMRGQQFDLFVYNLDQNSPFSKIQPVQKGMYGSVYFLKILDEQIAIKSYEFQKIGGSSEWSQTSTMKSIITQYLIYRQSSNLKAGPYMKNWLGYDLIAFNNRIQFAMEACQPIEGLTKEMAEQLTTSLFQLHIRRYVHNDITPNNIMFSPTYNKAIFIDYGFSQLLAQSIGYKTLTGFQGTADMVSKEMLQLFSDQNSQAYIDLYYNDLVALQKTIQYYSQQSTSNKNKQLNLLELIKISEYDNQLMESEQKENIVQFYLFCRLSWLMKMNIKSEQVKYLINYNNRNIVKKYYRLILKIIGQYIPSSQYENLLFNQLAWLRHTKDYINVCTILRIKTTTIFSNPSFYYIDSMVDYKKRFSKQMEYYQNIKNNSVDLNEFQIQLQCVQEKQFYQLCRKEQNIYNAMIYNILRLDTKQVQQEIKQGVAKCYLEFQGCLVQEQFEQMYFWSKKAIKYLLNQQISMTPTSHVQLFRSSLIIQCLLAQIDIIDELKTINKIVKNEQYESICIAIKEFCFIFYGIRFGELKYRFENEQTSKQIMFQLKILQGSLEQNILSQYSQGQELQSFTADLLHEILTSNLIANEQVDQIQHKLSKLQDQYIRSSLTKLHCYQIWQLVHYSNMFNIKKQKINAIRNLFMNKTAMRNFDSMLEEIYWRYILSRDPFNQLQRKGVIDRCFNHLNHYSLSKNIIINLGMVDVSCQIYHCFDEVINTIKTTFIKLKDNILLAFQISKVIKHLLIMHVQDHNFVIKLRLHVGSFIVDQLEQQVNCIIDMNRVGIEKTIFLIQHCTLQLWDITCRKILELPKSESRNNIIDKSQKIRRSLYWSILQKYAINNCLSEYDSYLMFFCYQLKQCQHQMNYQNAVDYFWDFKLQLSFYDRLPQFKLNHVMFHILQLLNRIYQNKGNEVHHLFHFLSQVTHYIWRYCSVHKDFDPYFSVMMVNCYSIKVTLILLGTVTGSVCCQQRYDYIYAIVEYLGANPHTQNILHFQNNISRFYLFEPQFFATLTSYKHKQLQRNHRFLLLLYVIALDQQRSQRKQRQLIVFIARNIFLHSWSSKQLILYVYFKNVLTFEGLAMNNKRKRKFVKKRLMSSLHPKYGNCYEYRPSQYISNFKGKLISDIKFRKQIKIKKKRIMHIIEE